MNNICTSIEQSKKLIELGIDINTADMFYSSWTILADGEYILSPLNGETVTNLQREYGNQIIPAWSLASLLELIPNYVINKVDDKIYANLYYGLKSSHDSLVDAAYEMICQLKENDKL